MLLAGAVALTLGCEIAKEASRNVAATAEASPHGVHRKNSTLRIY